ncbi:unnamed protein product [Mesocestoides corti]|uniref:SCP domain-containing protein n=1 Tax=Mesocestoides corti TaxID=53468 RepID=A0A0R3ULZ1_MESCO|nr:unnamed protein product [Mesocestoides corti]
MVWATSSGLGCAKKRCDNINPQWPKPIYLMACQYEPAYSMMMELLAVKWVDRCQFKHPNPSIDLEYRGFGQNLAISGGYKPSMTQMAQGWLNERNYYTYANNSCTRVCGHYTQMVWATSFGLGCAMKRCDNIKPEWPKPIYLMACQYYPA